MLFCPKCTETLHITDRQGIEIDFCPVCRGVWLDSGELEKIIERAIQRELQHMEYDTDDRETYAKPDKGKRGKYSKKYYKKFKKKHLLEEIFDLFD